jgi:hypothetical protein
MVAPDTWASAGADQNKVKQRASAKHVIKPTAVIFLSLFIIAPLVSWLGSDFVPHPAKEFLPSERKTFFGGDNLRRTGALTQCSMCPIGDISASPRLSLKIRRI